MVVISVNQTVIFSTQKKLKKKILGITCHNSKFLVKEAIKMKADYFALDPFINLN